MPHSPATVLLTRPEAQSRRFAAGLPGLKVVISPVLEIRMRPLNVDPRDYDALIFTSENGIRAVAAGDVAGLRGYAVGRHTAEVGAGFGLSLRAAGGDADALVEMIVKDKPAGRLLHLRGAHSRGEVAERLKGAGIETDSVIVYDQVECPLSPEAKTLLAGRGRVIAPVFSPRSSALLGRACDGATARLVVIAISDAALDAWDGPDPAEAIAVFDPSAEAMRQEILRQTGRAA